MQRININIVIIVAREAVSRTWWTLGG